MFIHVKELISFSAVSQFDIFGAGLAQVLAIEEQV
jgi:hypothetical protein